MQFQLRHATTRFSLDLNKSSSPSTSFLSFLSLFLLQTTRCYRSANTYLSAGLAELHQLLSGQEVPDLEEIRKIRAISVALSHG